jgi:hypothetical protein
MRPISANAPLLILTLVSLTVSLVAQDEKPEPPKEGDPTHRGCIVVEAQSKGGEVAGYMFGLGLGSLFGYLYSKNIKDVKPIEKYEEDLAKWKSKHGPKPTPPELSLATLTVLNWTGVKIVPLPHKPTDAQLQAAIDACDAFGK